MPASPQGGEKIRSSVRGQARPGW